MPLQVPKETAEPARNAFSDRFCLRVGAIAASQVNTEASLGVTGTSVGTRVDFEDALGLSSRTDSFRIDAYWRFNRANRIDVGYYDFKRSGSKTLSREIEWGGVTYPVSATVSSFFDTQIIPVRYTHSFIAEDDLDIGLGLGFYVMSLDAGIRTSGLGLSQTFTTPLPLPVIAVHATWEFLPRLQLFGTLQAFYVDLKAIGGIDHLQGSILDGTLGLEFEATRNVGIGAAVNYFALGANAAKNNLELDFDYDYSALFVFMALKF